MWQSTDNSETRSNLTALSPLSQPADLAETTSGDVTLSAIPAIAEPSNDANPADPASEAGLTADAPGITAAVGDASAGATAILTPAVDNDSGSVISRLAADGDADGAFHFSTAPDVFWFNDDESVADSSSVSTSDGTVLVVEPASGVWDSGSELAFTTKLAGLFHDNAPSDGFGSYVANNGSSAYFASYANHGPGDGLITTPAAALPADAFIATAPMVSEPSATPTVLPSVGGGGASLGGGSGGSGGTSSGSSLVNMSSAGLIININWDSSVNNAPAAFKTDVVQVVNYYESHFSNPVTITIDVGYGEVMGQSLGSNALGESITYFDSVSYSQLKSALVANLNASGQTAAAATLPATSPVNGQWWVSTAEEEALGLTNVSNNPDGFVGFSRSSNIFAYNENSIGGNQYDFQAVVAHEISEVMGRQMFDGTNGFGTGATYAPLDLFHYSAPGVRDFSGTKIGYASADGGKTNLDNFNTNPGGDFGDWASSAGNDAFNAFANPGVVNAVTQSDLTELNLLGWDPPATTTKALPAVTIQLASDTGWSSTDNITKNDTLSGTGDPNVTVTITSGTTTLGTTTANASGAWTFAPTGLADGQYTVAASETNTVGAGSASLFFTLDTSTPIVTSDTVSGTGISGASGVLSAGAIAVFTLAMNESVLVSGGTPALTLNDGGTATYDAAHSTSTSLAFDYTVGSGQYTNALSVTGVHLNGATVTEIAGNAANFGGAAATFPNLVVDGTTPVAKVDHAHDLLNGSVSASASGGVLANDSDSDRYDVLSVSAVNGSSVNVGHVVSGAYGTLDLNSNGSYTYVNTNPSAVTALGGVTDDTFSYTVSNGHGGTTSSVLNVLITSPGQTYVTGTSGSTLNAGNGSYVLDGSAGNMTLTAGNSGTQWLVGGPGDTLKAGSSTDTFLFAPNFGNETVNNFNTKIDVIDLPHSLFPNFAAIQADMHAVGSSSVITLDAADSIMLNHVAALSLHSQNFHFF